MIDAVCGSQSYAAHLLPIWTAVPLDERGDLYAPHEDIHNHIPLKSILGTPGSPRRDPHPDRLTLVASWSDLCYVKHRPCVMIEHGSGQRYRGKGGDWDRHPSNPGGRERENVVLYVCPSEMVADANREMWPDADYAVVGPTNLDALLSEPRTPDKPPVVAVSSHWRNPQCRESGWAFPHYSAAITGLSREFPTIGHGHPRVQKYLSRFYTNIGVEFVPALYNVLSRCSVYVVDNSSSGYEAAALGIPTVWLWSPTWRKGSGHNLRFDGLVPGITCDTPDDLLPAVREAIADFEPWPSIRREVTARVYSGGLDGQASQRAVEAIRRVSSPATPCSTTTPVNS